MTLLKKPISRVSQSTLGSTYGSDSDKRLVITLIPGNGGDVHDLISIRPAKTRRAETIAVIDVYRFALQCRVNAAHMARLREIKARKAAARVERARQRELRKPV